MRELAYLPEYFRLKKLLRWNIELKGKYFGKRCFILGTGPSIKSQNMRLLRNEFIISLNNFFVHNDYKYIVGGDRLKYHMVAPIHLPLSEEEWTSWFTQMNHAIPSNVQLLIGLSGYKGNAYRLVRDHLL